MKIDLISEDKINGIIRFIIVLVDTDDEEFLLKKIEAYLLFINLETTKMKYLNNKQALIKVTNYNNCSKNFIDSIPKFESYCMKKGVIYEY